MTLIYVFVRLVILEIIVKLTLTFVQVILVKTTDHVNFLEVVTFVHAHQAIQGQTVRHLIHVTIIHAKMVRPVQTAITQPTVYAPWVILDPTVRHMIHAKAIHVKIVDHVRSMEVISTVHALSVIPELTAKHTIHVMLIHVKIMVHVFQMVITIPAAVF